MNTLKDYEKELNKCSKCALCEQACPLYKLNPNDCVVSKGKFIMLHGVTKGDLKLSKNINKYIDMCLRCGKCNDFCPSGIDVCEILNCAKYEYMNDKLSGKIINFLESKLIFSNFIKIISKISNLCRPSIKPALNAEKNILYFKGCVNQMLPNTDRNLAKIFKNSSINIITPDFDCCGLPFLSDGNMKRFIETANHNLKLIENCNYDYLVTDCASCEYTLKEYPKYIEQQSSQINPEKFLNWGDIIAQENFRFKYKKQIKVTFHKPCHLADDKFLKQILNNCEKVEYIELPDYDECCGFAGSFSIKNPKMSAELAIQKAKNINKTGADYVITTCPGCILGLKYGLFLTKGKAKVISLLDFLAKADIIE